MAMLEDFGAQFAIRGVHSLTGDNEAAFESTTSVRNTLPNL